MAKIIRCKGCNKVVAEITKASVIKNIACYCGKCHAERELILKLGKIGNKNPFDGMFNGFKY